MLAQVSYQSGYVQDRSSTHNGQGFKSSRHIFIGEGNPFVRIANVRRTHERTRREDLPGGKKLDIGNDEAQRSF